MNALILSAGLGTRFRPYTENRAKPAIEFLTIPTLAFPLYYLQQLSVERVVFNTHHLPKTVESAVQKIISDKVETHFSHESPEILGSGGAIRKAFEHLKSADFFLLNGDSTNLFQNRLAFRSVEQYKAETDAFATFLLYPHPEAGRSLSAVWIDEEAIVHGFGLTPPECDKKLYPYHYPGVLLLSPGVEKYLPEGESNILYDGLVNAIKDGQKVTAFIEPNLTWRETGNIEDFMLATKEYLEILSNPSSAYHEALWQLLRYYRPNISLDSSHDKQLLQCGDSASAKNLSYNGFVVLGNDCVLPNGLELFNNVIQSETEVTNSSFSFNDIIM